MTAPVSHSSLVNFARTHERQLAAGWIGLVFVLFLGLALTPIRVRVLDRLQGAADRYEARWDRKLAWGAQLVDARRYDEAAIYLERLDAEFPARTSRYARDKDREYLLRLLARSYEATAHKAKAMATWERLVAFDSLNYRNHFGYAQAAERLLSGWALALEARNGYARALDLLPTHLPSLRGYIAYYNDRSEWREITAGYRTYLDALLIEQVTVRIGDRTMVVPVQVDGRAHDFDLAVNVPLHYTGDLVVVSPSYPIAVEQLTLLAPARVGSAAPRSEHVIVAPLQTATGMTQSGGAWVPHDSAPALHIAIPAQDEGLARVVIRLRAFKLLDESLWRIVMKCYRNLLDAPGQADAVARTVTFTTPAAADSAFNRLDWSQGGQYIPGSR